jgi:hypothetical protein
MKDFIRPRGRLRTLPLPARVVYSVFAAFTLIALAFTAWLAEDMLGADLHELDAYYAGKPSDRDAHVTSGNGGQGGPVLELPPEADAPSASPPMPLRKLLEVTHFHLFSMPVYLLILSHLFMLSRMGERAKLFWIALGTASVAAHLAAPWLARSGGAGAKAAYGGSGAAMMVSMLVMTLVPLWEMWSPIPGGERSADGGAASTD